MPQVPRKKSPAPAEQYGGLETARLYWKKECSPAGLQPGDWLLIPLDASDQISGYHPLYSQSISELVSAFKALEALRSWLKEQLTPFSLETAVSGCFRIGQTVLTSDIQTGLHLLLQDLGCTPLEKQTSVSRFWYQPPPPSSPKITAVRGFPGQSGRAEKDYPSAPAHEIYRIGTVMRLSGLSRSSIYRLEALGLFPGRVQLSGSAVGWRSAEIQAWIASRKSAIAKGER